MSKPVVTTISGPPHTYKTTMLITVANAEAKRGRAVEFFTSENPEASLRAQGLVPRVTVYASTEPRTNCENAVVSRSCSTSLPDQYDSSEPDLVWVAKQTPRE
jgi:hypothetical protein